MVKNKQAGVRIAAGVLIMAGIMTLIISVASLMTEKGSLTEDMMTPIVCAGIFITGFTGALILNRRQRTGRLIRGFIIGLVLFGAPYMIGKMTSAEPVETGKSVAVLVFSLLGSISGAVITNKNQGKSRR